MEQFNLIWEEVLQNKLVQSAMAIVVSIIIYSIVHKMVMKGEGRAKKLGGKSRTYIKLVMSIVRYGFVCLTVLTILQINGVNVSSLLAGLGLAGVIIGLAVQDALKDIIRGFSLISDNYFSVGDVVKFDDDEGRVTEIGLRTTKIKSIIDGSETSIANRNIEQAKIASSWTSIVLPLPYELKIAEADKLMEKVTQRIAEQEDVEEVINRGIKELADSSINYLISIKCKKREVRAANKRLAYRNSLLELEKAGISVPYPQMDVHSKKS